MAIQLTLDQEQRLQAIVNAGGYPSVDEALSAALAVVETKVNLAFEGAEGELDELLAEGEASSELSEEEFWSSVDRKTDAMLAVHPFRNTFGWKVMRYL
jgi:Arc/MetJ-type ribon-helix-helix transcriptional regulator